MINYRSWIIATCLSTLLFIWLVGIRLNDGFPWRSSREFLVKTPALRPNQTSDVEIVVASIKKEDTSWLATYLQSWTTNIYVADDPSAPLTVPMNKGRESMVYLTYIIDRYDSLPKSIIFIHASRFAWHNDDPDYDAVPTLRNFQLPYLEEQGYVNMRCVWVIGCPQEIRPVEDENAEDKANPSAKGIYKQSFQELLPELPVPSVVAVSCCSQFGATGEMIRRRPREDYIRYRQWLMDTPLEDERSGRVLEFSWHIIFGKEAVHCPSPGDCYCRVFGLCGLDCSSGSCGDRYILPPYANLPPKWPEVGWKGEDRNYTGLPI